MSLRKFFGIRDRVSGAQEFWPAYGFRLVCAWALAGLLAAGCHTTKRDPKFADVDSLTKQQASTPTLVSVGDPGATETLKPGDTLNIAYADLPANVQPFDGPVKEDGTITLIQNQTFTAAGKTTGELEREIRRRYVPDYYKYMTVTVTLRSDTRFYYVEGEVKAPGRQIYSSRITVTRAIASCGDFTDFAKKRAVTLIRADGHTKIPVNCIKAIENPALDPEVYPGDKIHVPRRIF